MAVARPEGRLLPALFDRLCDDGLPAGLPAAGGRPEAGAWRDPVLRDLRDLFNTTRSAPAALADSVIGYGLPAIAGRPASSLPPEDLARALMDAILRFEPRLAPDSLRVTPDDETGAGDVAAPRPVRRFRLSACLRAPAGGAELHLLTEIDLDTGHARLTEAR